MDVKLSARFGLAGLCLDDSMSPRLGVLIVGQHIPNSRIRRLTLSRSTRNKHDRVNSDQLRVLKYRRISTHNSSIASPFFKNLEKQFHQWTRESVVEPIYLLLGDASNLSEKPGISDLKSSMDIASRISQKKSQHRLYIEHTTFVLKFAYDLQSVLAIKTD